MLTGPVAKPSIDDIPITFTHFYILISPEKSP